MITVTCGACGELADVGTGKICRVCGASLPVSVYDAAKEAETAYGELPAVFAALGNSKTIDIARVNDAERLYRKCSELKEKLVAYQSFRQDDFNRLENETIALYSNIQEAKQKEARRQEEAEERRQKEEAEAQRQKEAEERRQKEEAEAQRQKEAEERRQNKVKSVMAIICGIIGIGLGIGIIIAGGVDVRKSIIGLIVTVFGIGVTFGVISGSLIIFIGVSFIGGLIGGLSVIFGVIIGNPLNWVIGGIICIISIIYTLTRDTSSGIIISIIITISIVGFTVCIGVGLFSTIGSGIVGAIIGAIIGAIALLSMLLSS